MDVLLSEQKKTKNIEPYFKTALQIFFISIDNVCLGKYMKLRVQIC